jgi:hypothetical protein
MKFIEQSQTSGKPFLKLKDKESVRGVFRGDPYDFRQHWINQKSVLCTGATTCTQCKEGLKSTFRFRLNFFVKDDQGGYSPKIFEQGWTVYSQLRDLHGADYDLEKTVVKITRSGSGTDTSYSVVPLPNGLLTKEVNDKIAQIPLLDLKDHVDPSEKYEDPSSIPFTESDIPF